MVSTRRLELERVFDSPWFTARLRRGVNEAAVRTAAFGLRLGGPRIARELPSLRVSSVTHFLPSLPAGSDGCRLLHLSDLHLESLRAWQTVTGAMSRLDWDALLFTGDFAEGPDTTELVARFVSLLPERPQAPRVAVLGNHDRSGLLPALAAGGFEVLTNGSRPLGDRWGGVWIAGVDDPATFRTHDLDAAMSGVPADACTILMAHSPDLADWGIRPRLCPVPVRAYTRRAIRHPPFRPRRLSDTVSAGADCGGVARGRDGRIHERRPRSPSRSRARRLHS